MRESVKHRDIVCKKKRHALLCQLSQTQMKIREQARGEIENSKPTARLQRWHYLPLSVVLPSAPSSSEARRLKLDYVELEGITHILRLLGTVERINRKVSKCNSISYGYLILTQRASKGFGGYCVVGLTEASCDTRAYRSLILTQRGSGGSRATATTS